MPDLYKRRTLKFMGAAPLFTVPLLSGAAELQATDASALPLPAPRTNMQLSIDIIDSSAVPDNNLLIKNTTDEPLAVSGFMPGHIIFDNKLIDLNEAVAKETLVLGPGQSRAFNFTLWPLLSAGPMEYVWADHTAITLSEETTIYRLGAFLADTNAVIYADTSPVIPS